MSRDPSNGKTRSSKSARFNDVKWINWSLSAEEKAVIKAWELTLEELDNLETKTIQSGHKITTSYDNYGDCYTASIVPTAENKLNQGFILTGKGSTPTKARKQALYIHLKIFGGDWSSYSTGAGKEEIDD